MLVLTREQVVEMLVQHLGDLGSQISDEKLAKIYQLVFDEQVDLVDEEDLEDVYFDHEEVHDDSPSLSNCDDHGTGEGKYHGRM